MVNVPIVDKADNAEDEIEKSLILLRLLIDLFGLQWQRNWVKKGFAASFSGVGNDIFLISRKR